MADHVPTSGLWQSDPQLQQLVAALARAQATGPASRGRGYQEALALRNYVEAPGTRQRLGIPNNYWPDPRTNGQTLYDPNQNQLRDALIAGGSMAAGGYGLGAALGGVMPPAAGGAAAFDAAPAISSATGAANAAALGGTAAGGATAASGGLSGLLKSLTSGSNLPSLIGLGTSLASGAFSGGGGSGAGEADRIKAITEARMRRADPLHQMLVSLAASRMPTNVQRPVPDVPLPEPK